MNGLGQGVLEGGFVTMGTFHKVAEMKNLPTGEGMAVEVEGHKIALFNVGPNQVERAAPVGEEGPPLR